MTMNDVYKLCKALVALADGEPVKNYKGSVSKAREFKEQYEAMNSNLARRSNDEEE